jgi:hypothetical protein
MASCGQRIEERVSKENAKKIETALISKGGITLAEIQAMLGTGEACETGNLPSGLKDLMVDGRKVDWRIWERQKRKDNILVGFAHDGKAEVLNTEFHATGDEYQGRRVIRAVDGGGVTQEYKRYGPYD